ncbi:MerR family transcriptional regulator [uncultured Lacinutrix sp.]|uniref:MerR family transcriptional regulator n=1 Tax=uncultured Lacinutrix sp. TaxID=574032 RepID=UPI002610ACD9|nr:MerR family transcriptional regulator [uncultured Lacinutrix sp.]
MNNIKTNFSIKDLENLSGVKAHTIRIWEKRYMLLEPNRSDTNIRNYNLESLQKLLNITYLNNNGIKISKIAELKEQDITEKVKEIASLEKNEDDAINALKISMLNFDQALFNKTYDNQIEKRAFNDIFYSIFLPLFNDIGLLWQTNTIIPAHENFISTLIKQKVLINIEKLANSSLKNETKTFVLFLPENEIHDIGLLFVNYELRSRGYKTIYLGESVPLDNLSNFKILFKDITFITYFTIKPDNKDMYSYINNFNKQITNNGKANLCILGYKTSILNEEKLPKGTYKFNSIENLLNSI